MNSPAIRVRDRQAALVVQLSACISVISFLFYFQHGQILLYGDAVAHINIARRVFDSQTPGPLQLGTVWLPLPHLLMIPFVVSDWAWRTGFGASIPSMLAYILGALGIFRLVRGALQSSLAAWIAAIVYIANPNLIYLQSTAMTEALYVALFVWSIVYLSEFVIAARASDLRSTNSKLLKCGLCLAASSLTRYDGWFLSAAMCVAVLIFWACSSHRPELRRAVTKFVLVTAAAPILWIAYNALVYRNPWEFATGPYSATAIERKTSQQGSPPHPGARDLPVAASYFLKAGELTMMKSNWHRLWAAVSVAGTAAILIFERKLWVLLLFLVPRFFYPLAIAYGGVPIFLPPWWPFAIYNARYGVQLLPAFSVMAAVLIFFLMRHMADWRRKSALAVAMLIFVTASYASVWRSQPIAFREAWVNSRTRIALETALAAQLKTLPPDAIILMYLGDHVGALQKAGIPLRRVIYEGNHRTWKQPVDPEGLWERALVNPEKYADFVVATDGDAVAHGVNKQYLSSLAVIHVPGQRAVTIYKVAPPSRRLSGGHPRPLNVLSLTPEV